MSSIEAFGPWPRGMQTGDGQFADKQTHLLELCGAVVDQDGGLALRPPLVKLGDITGDVQGWLELAGSKVVFAPRGTTPPVVSGVTVVTKFFDPPPHASGAWSLLAAKVVGTDVVAVIQHAMASTPVPQLTLVHVFDGMANYPTYADDPATPVNWSNGGYPLHAYGADSSRPAGSYAAWPAAYLESLVSRAWLSRQDNNVACSGIQRPRVWNSRTGADIDKTGRQYVFTVPDSGLLVAAVPEPHADFATLALITGYVLERLQSDNSWAKVTETSSAPGAGQWQLTSSTPAWASTARATITTGAFTAGTLLRLRVCIQPEVEIVTGCELMPAPRTFQTDGTRWEFLTDLAFSGVANYVVDIDGRRKDLTFAYTWAESVGVAKLTWLRESGTLPAQLQSAAIAAGGSGYTLGDTLTLVGGTGTTLASVQVATVGGGGAVTGVTVLLTGGYYTTPPTNPISTTGGTGTGCTLNGTWATDFFDTSILTVYGVTDTDFAIKVSVDDAPAASFTVADSPATPGWVRVSFAAAQTHGLPYTATLTPVTGKTLTVSQPDVVVGAGQVRYEGQVKTSPALLRSSLPVGTSSYVAARGDTATQHTPVSAPTWTGLDRYRLRILGTVTLSGGGAITAQTPYRYAFQDQTAAWVERNLRNLDTWAGSGEATVINASTNNPAGGVVTGMIGIRDRLLVSHANRTQLWAMDADINQLAFLDSWPFGTTAPMTEFYGSVLMRAQRGFRLVSLVGLNFQGLEDNNVGEGIQALNFAVSAAAFWPWTGGYVAFGTLTGGDAYADEVQLPADSPLRTGGGGFMVLSFSRERGVQAWSWCPVPGVSSVLAGSLVADGARMTFRSGSSVYALDADAATFTDHGGTPVQAFAATPWTACKAPGRRKRAIRLGLMQRGTTAVAVSPTAHRPAAIPVCVVEGHSYGQRRIGCTQTGEAFAFRFTGAGPEPWALEGVQLDYLRLAR